MSIFETQSKKSRNSYINSRKLMSIYENQYGMDARGGKNGCRKHKREYKMFDFQNNVTQAPLGVLGATAH